MKKYFLFYSIVALLAAACTKGNEMEPAEARQDGEMRFYGVALLPQETRGAAQHDRLWHNGTTIKVKFLNGADDLREKVKNYARQWEKYANITFKFIDTGDAHIRVGFDWNDNRTVTWSYIGTDCKFVPDQAEATMSFALFDYVEEDVIRGDVLRAFGQALGLELENRNINFSPRWAPNPRSVPNYWAFNISDAEWELLRKYVFDPLDADNAISTSAYDELSIMRWPFPANIILNGGPLTQNTELSQQDKIFAMKLYPKDPIATIIPENNDGVWLGVNEGHSLIIDWSNGKYDKANEGDEYYYCPTYEQGRKISIRGEAESLYSISVRYVVSVDVSTAKYLKSIYCAKSRLLRILDISNNQLLEKFQCPDCELFNLDVSNNPLLTNIDCEYNPFTKDKLATISFANSLPDRTGLESGRLTIFSSSDPDMAEHLSWIEDICAAKNWRIE